MDKEELNILKSLDAVVREVSDSTMLERIISRVERRLIQNSDASLAWEPVPLAVYSGGLPDMIRSSWVFVLRACANTGAERHPNSHQRMVSYRGSGDLQIQTCEIWCSNHLVSDPEANFEARWVSIPPNTWHRASVSKENWVVVSFHTVPEDELIEERPNSAHTDVTHQRRYLEHGNCDM